MNAIEISCLSKVEVLYPSREKREKEKERRRETRGEETSKMSKLCTRFIDYHNSSSVLKDFFSLVCCSLLQLHHRRDNLTGNAVKSR